MTKPFKLALWLLMLLAIAYGALAQPNLINVTYDLSDFTTQPLWNQKIAIAPLAQIGTNGNVILVPRTNTVPLGTNSILVVSNMIAGYAYQVSLEDSDGTPWFQFTNYFSNTLSGNVNAATNIGYVPAGIYGYVSLGTPYNAIGSGTNITLTTNGGVLYVNSSGGVANISATNVVGPVSGITAATVNSAIYITATNSATGSMPFLLDPVSGLSYTLFLTNDNGVLTLQVGTNGYSTASNYVGPSLFNGGLYYPMFLTNDNGVLTVMVSTQGY